MTEWKEGIWIAVSALIVAVFFTLMHTVVAAVKESARVEQAKTDSVEVLKQYYKIGRYDNVIVPQADVINCIMENKTRVPAVIVKKDLVLDDPNATFNFDLNASFIVNHIWNNGTNSYYMWDGVRADTDSYPDYRRTELNNYIPLGSTYRAYLNKDAGGEILHIWFRRVPAWVKFHNVIVSQSEVINCILESKILGMVFQVRESIEADVPNPVLNYSYRWYGTNPSSDYTMSFLTQRIPPGSTYRSIVKKSSSGVVQFVWFGRIS